MMDDNQENNQTPATDRPVNQPSEPTERPTARPVVSSGSTKPEGKGRLKKPALILLAILLILAASGGTYWYRDMQAKDSLKIKDSEIATLKSQNADLKSEAEKAADDAAAADEAATATDAETRTANIVDAIKSDNTSALTSYMATSVNVILAASEAYGTQTQAQAIDDLKYLDDATDPWDFELDAATLADYRSGDYASYFPEGAVVGKSANDYIVAFTFDAAGKINGIFMANKASVL